MTLTRRDWLRTSVSTIGLLGAGALFGRVQNVCTQTPDQPEGPFYPVRDQHDKNSDLTLVAGHTNRALGQVIYVEGVVSDDVCKPVAGAVVEIWQACATGRYNHPGDADNSGALDPDFQYWGITTTNAQGEYSFKTILPGHYRADENWMRPPHIHFKVHKRGYHELTTQMYFAGNVYNDGDLILRRLSDTEKDAVVIAMDPQGRCNFNIGLRAVRA